jgi:hypothetical protein
MLRAGAYAAVVTPLQTDFGELACQFGKSNKKQTPLVTVAFEILRGPDAGQRISWIGYFTEKTEKRTLEALRICGFTGDDIDKFADQRPTNEVEIIVEQETGEDGKVRPKVAWVNDPRRSGGLRLEAPLRDGDLRKFGAQFKSKLKAIPAVKTVEAKREPPSEGVARPTTIAVTCRPRTRTLDGAGQPATTTSLSEPPTRRPVERPGPLPLTPPPRPKETHDHHRPHDARRPALRREEVDPRGQVALEPARRRARDRTAHRPLRQLDGPARRSPPWGPPVRRVRRRAHGHPC